MIQTLLAFLIATASAEEAIKFDISKIKVGGKEIRVQVADNDDKREHGLMFVKEMPADQGMLFVFEEARPLNFWMKNTLIPLSIGFFDENGVLLDTQEMKPAESVMVTHPPTYESSGPALFALEMNKDWFPKHKIKAGAKLELVGTSSSKLLTTKLARRSSR